MTVSIVKSCLQVSKQANQTPLSAFDRMKVNFFAWDSEPCDHGAPLAESLVFSVVWLLCSNPMCSGFPQVFPAINA